MKNATNDHQYEANQPLARAEGLLAFHAIQSGLLNLDVAELHQYVGDRDNERGEDVY